MSRTGVTSDVYSVKKSHEDFFRRCKYLLCSIECSCQLLCKAQLNSFAEYSHGRTRSKSLLLMILATKFLYARRRSRPLCRHCCRSGWSPSPRAPSNCPGYAVEEQFHGRGSPGVARRHLLFVLFALVFRADLAFRGRGCAWQVALDGRGTCASIPVNGWIDPRWWCIVQVLFVRLRAHRVRACEQGDCSEIAAIWGLVSSIATQLGQL